MTIALPALGAPRKHNIDLSWPILVLFAALERESFAVWLDRIALGDQAWPRRVQLEVVGFPADADGRR